MKFDSLLLKDAVVEGDGVIPPMREDDLSSSDSSDQDDDEDSIFAKGLSRSLSLSRFVKLSVW